MAEAEVLPADLKFRFQLNRQLSGTITINNPHDKRLAFKIKTTAPKKYVVRPSSGIAEPRSSVNVQVIMQAQKEYPTDMANCKDKFMVQTTLLEDADVLDKDTFTKEGRKDMKEARLRVILDGPAAPPSPVPEVNEAVDGEDANAVAAAAAAGVISSRGGTDGNADSRLKNTLSELAVVSAENTGLKAQLASVTRDRDELRRKLEAVEQRGGIGSTVSAIAHGDPVLKSGLTVVHLILVGIFAFLLGHYA